MTVGRAPCVGLGLHSLGAVGEKRWKHDLALRSLCGCGATFAWGCRRKKDGNVTVGSAGKTGVLN